MSREAIDPIFLRVATGAFGAACDEMGELLVHSAHSANIKERRDCSAGLFDADGQMTAQAAHIPVHLGAMPASVEAVLGDTHEPGDFWVMNDPYRGGTHLPDITVVTPIFGDGGHLGFAACRAHHADVGGSVPGSMPALSRTLDEEGVVIAPTRISAHEDLDERLDELVAGMRNPAQRRADLHAQIAACLRGSERIAEFVARHGVARYEQACSAVLDYAERLVRDAIAAIPDGEYSAADVLEGGGDQARPLPLTVRATVAGDTMTVDFTGSAGQHEGNLNCPLAVTRSAVYFAARVLTSPDAPACAGAYRPIEVIVPEGCLLNASAPAAVAGGNVETSSRVADLVLSAFGRAQGQGTMNNVTLGNDRFTYYETLAGGQAASAAGPGPTAVHVAMSNTLNTPVEAIELEFPLRVTRYEVRRGSGGDGATRGGDGIVREFEALEPMQYSLIAERRLTAPRGAGGGAPALPGVDTVNGERVAGKSHGSLAEGDRLRIETPGGGGFGAPEKSVQSDRADSVS